MSSKQHYSHFRIFQYFFTDLIYLDPFHPLPPHLFHKIPEKGNSANEMIKCFRESSSPITPNLFNDIFSF